MSKTKKIAFITAEVDRDLTADDRLVIEPLRKRNIIVEPLVWGNQKAALSFDSFVFRSCWDYDVKFEAFNKWIYWLKSLGKPILNSAEVTIKNLNKRYLIELLQNGVDIPRTIFLPKALSVSKQDIERAVRSLDSNEIVIKPAVSLSGHNTFRFKSTQLEEIYQMCDRLTDTGEVILQEFVSNILSDGELSLVFFDKKFSHAVRKIPKAGEFRCQNDYGGTHQSVMPSIKLIEAAVKILNCISEPLTFARVDIVESGERVLLMELELVDPALFLEPI